MDLRSPSKDPHSMSEYPHSFFEDSCYVFISILSADGGNIYTSQDPIS